MNWFKQHRMEWIAETIRVFGFINREHLERKFGISQPQASLDLAAFQRANPTAMTYDLSAKRYVATRNNQLRTLCPDCGGGWTFDFAHKRVYCRTCSNSGREVVAEGHADAR